MRLYLDESITEDLRYIIEGHYESHDVRTARFMGWKGWPDGSYLPLADGEFDAVLTCDQSIPNQQNLSRMSLRIIVLHGHSNRIQDILPLLPEAMEAVDDLSRGQVVRIYPP